MSEKTAAEMLTELIPDDLFDLPLRAVGSVVVDAEGFTIATMDVVAAERYVRSTNALPELAALVEAIRRWRDGECDHGAYRPSICGCDLEAEIEAADDALTEKLRREVGDGE